MKSNRAIIYTEETECQDCYRCVRECPVKAIRFENGHAFVDPELCILCGKCVTVCPANAKHQRDDLVKVREILQESSDAILSIAPSWRGEFPEISEGQLIHAAKILGFAGVSETALGADAVSSATGTILSGKKEGIFISSACPAVVEYIHKYRHAQKKQIVPLVSPMIAHCSMLKSHFGEKTPIIFAGPCIAKKIEADRHPDLCNAAITFKDLVVLFEEKSIEFDEIEVQESEERFVGGCSITGARYPYEGGMIESVRKNNSDNDTSSYYMSLSGLETIDDALDNLPDNYDNRIIFLELLSCQGGCIKGPGCIRDGIVQKKMEILELVCEDTSTLEYPKEMEEVWRIAPVPVLSHSDDAIEKALELLGKHTKRDEINCDGCGYNSCREFSRAFIEGKAEEMMCVSHMRKIAQKKANILIERIPLGVVIVDSHMRIVESNKNFARLMGEDGLLMWECSPGLEGADLSKLVPFSYLFNVALQKGGEIKDKSVKLAEKILSLTVFPIVEKQSACGIMQDITTPWVNRDAIIKNARNVISKNLETVQQIAYLLGENAADNEVILNSIIESFSGPSDE